MLTDLTPCPSRQLSQVSDGRGQSSDFLNDLLSLSLSLSLVT